MALLQKETKLIWHLLLPLFQLVHEMIRELSQLKNNSEKLSAFIVLNNNCCVAAQMLTSSQSWSGAGTENALLMAGGGWTVSFGGHVISQDLKVITHLQF